jgi:hypothetical protein
MVAALGALNVGVFIRFLFEPNTAVRKQGPSLQISLLAPQFRLKVPHRSPRQPTLDLHRTAKTEIRRHDPVPAGRVNGTQAQTSTGRRANTPKSTQAQKCKQAGRPLLAKSISGLVFQYRQSSKRDPQRRRNTTQPFRSTWLRYRRTTYSDLVHRARPVCEKFPISRKKESLQSHLHAPA